MNLDVENEQTEDEKQEDHIKTHTYAVNYRRIYDQFFEEKKLFSLKICLFIYWSFPN